jgi:uncharacterized protein (UPF0332 family)/predicted nucleotidyltransferase
MIMSKSRCSTKEKLDTVLADLHQQFEVLYGSRLVHLILYGSQARGDAESGSDIDLLVVLEGPVDPNEEIRRTSQIVADLSLKYNKMISRVFIQQEELRAGTNPFLDQIRREGIIFDPATHNFLKTSTEIAPLFTPRSAGSFMTSQQLDLLQKASDSLEAAKLLAEQGYNDFAVSRAYYVMFYVAKAFLLEEELTPSKHSTVISLFGERFIKRNRLPTKFHRYLIDAEDHRINADYKTGSTVADSIVTETINHAEEFLELGNRLKGAA